MLCLRCERHRRFLLVRSYLDHAGEVAGPAWRRLGLMPGSLMRVCIRMPRRRQHGGHPFRMTKLALSKPRYTHRLSPLRSFPSREPDFRRRAPPNRPGISPLHRPNLHSTRFLPRLVILAPRSLRHYQRTPRWMPPRLRVSSPVLPRPCPWVR